MFKPVIKGIVGPAEFILQYMFSDTGYQASQYGQTRSDTTTSTPSTLALTDTKPRAGSTTLGTGIGGGDPTGYHTQQKATQLPTTHMPTTAPPPIPAGKTFAGRRV